MCISPPTRFISAVLPRLRIARIADSTSFSGKLAAISNLQKIFKKSKMCIDICFYIVYTVDTVKENKTNGGKENVRP